jgi:hypothetical protein
VQLGIEIAKTFTFVTSVWPKDRNCKNVFPFLSQLLQLESQKKKQIKRAKFFLYPRFYPFLLFHQQWTMFDNRKSNRLPVCLVIPSLSISHSPSQATKFS